MAQTWAKSFYNSKSWQQCRDAFIAGRILADGGACQECRVNQGYIVHHTIMLNESNVNDPDVALNHNHMKYVCKECHDMYDGHGVGKKIKPLCRFDEKGNPVSLREIDNPPYKTAP